MEAVPPVITKNNLTYAEWMAWGKESLIFTAPVVVPMLLALQNGATWQIAMGAAYMGFIALLLNLYGKYKQGI